MEGDKPEESIINLEKQSSLVEELSQILKRDDNFIHFVLQNAPVVIGHQVILFLQQVFFFVFFSSEVFVLLSSSFSFCNKFFFFLVK
ncbi:putative histidine kinase [Helianthus anomalus]